MEQFIMEGNHGGRILRHLVPMAHSHEGEKDECEYAAHCFYFLVGDTNLYNSPSQF